MKYLLSLVAALFLFAGCATSPMSRIDANRGLYESWPIEMQSAVLEGKAVKDMTPEMVRMALGAPTRIEPRAGSTADEEVWVYVKSDRSNIALPNIGVGGSIGGVGVSTGGSGRRSGGSRGSSISDETQVVFRKGVVARVN